MGYITPDTATSLLIDYKPSEGQLTNLLESLTEEAKTNIIAQQTIKDLKEMF